MFKHKIIPIIMITTLMIISITLFVIRTVEYNSCIAEQQRLSKMGPVITLKGENSIKLNLFDQFIEPGYTATDMTDGDLTAKVTVINNFKSNRIGEYSASYLIKDKDGHKANSIRKIEVVTPAIKNTTGIPILMYHFFYDASKGEAGADNNFVEIASFDQQMKYLVDNQYYFPTWTEVSDYLDGKLNLPAKSIVITDDDGSESFFRLAYPVIAKYQIPITSFLVTSWSNPASFEVDRNIVSFQSHSQAMHQGGCSTGHGGRFMCIDYQSGVNDLNTSKQTLGSSDVFCYPFGDYNDQAKQMLSDAGFKLAVTTEYGKAKIGDDKLQLPRVRISKTTTIEQFIAAIQ